MKSEEIVKFLKGNIEPLKDRIYGDRYRAAAYLCDDTFLPCVVFQSQKAQVDLALCRIEELRDGPFQILKYIPIFKPRNSDVQPQYRQVVETFVSSGSRLADYDIKAVEVSRYAWPLDVLNNIHGETVMSWTAFVVEMRDGTMYSYGTNFRTEFFDLPKGYSHADITKIHSGMVYSKEHGIVPFRTNTLKHLQTYREKPFFTCYLEEL